MPLLFRSGYPTEDSFRPEEPTSSTTTASSRNTHNHDNTWKMANRLRTRKVADLLSSAVSAIDTGFSLSEDDSALSRSGSGSGNHWGSGSGNDSWSEETGAALTVTGTDGHPQVIIQYTCE